MVNETTIGFSLEEETVPQETTEYLTRHLDDLFMYKYLFSHIRTWEICLFTVF